MVTVFDLKYQVLGIMTCLWCYTLIALKITFLGFCFKTVLMSVLIEVIESGPIRDGLVPSTGLLRVSGFARCSNLSGMVLLERSFTNCRKKSFGKCVSVFKRFRVRSPYVPSPAYKEALPLVIRPVREYEVSVVPG